MVFQILNPDGIRLADNIPGAKVRAVAQEISNQIGRSVFYSESILYGRGTTDLGVEVEPTENESRKG